MGKTVLFCWIRPLGESKGGVERVTRRLIEGLSTRGIDCLFLLQDTENGGFVFQDQRVTDLGAFLADRSVDTIVYQNGCSSSELTEILDRAGWRGNYILCHHNEPRYLQKIFGFRRAVSEVLAPVTPGKTKLLWLLRLLGYPVWRRWADHNVGKTQRRNYERCQRYVLLSPNFLPEFSHLIGQKAIPKAVAIPNPLSFEIDPEDAKRFTKRNEVLIAARLDEPQKRISLALKAWQQIEKDDREEWTLKIVGEGPDAEALQDMARTMGLKRVQFLGYQDPIPHFRSASLLFMTSRAEGWGLTLTEAQQTGTVPIAFDSYMSLRDIIDHGETGVIVRNGDVAAFAREAKQLMENPVRRQTMAMKGIAACQRYRLEAVLDKWADIL